MDGDTVLTAPFRDPRYAPRSLEVKTREDGALLLLNTTPWSDRFSTTNAALDHWVKVAPGRDFIAERAGEGWRVLTYAQAHDRISRLATDLKFMGLGPEKPLLILARNSIDHALIAYAAMRIGCPIAPLSPQYGQAGADPSRLAHATNLIHPHVVFVEDGEAAAEAIARDPVLHSLPVIASRHARAGQMHHGVHTLQSGRINDARRGIPTDLCRTDCRFAHNTGHLGTTCPKVLHQSSSDQAA